MLAALALSLALGGPAVAAPAPDIPARSGGVRVVAVAVAIAEVLEPVTNDPRAPDRPRRLSRTRDGRLLVEFE